MRSTTLGKQSHGNYISSLTSWYLCATRCSLRGAPPMRRTSTCCPVTGAPKFRKSVFSGVPPYFQEDFKTISRKTKSASGYTNKTERNTQVTGFCNKDLINLRIHANRVSQRNPTDISI